MKNELVTIGDFVENELRDSPADQVTSLRARFW
jgi:hypothetical protein